MRPAPLCRYAITLFDISATYLYVSHDVVPVIDKSDIARKASACFSIRYSCAIAEVAFSVAEAARLYASAEVEVEPVPDRDIHALYAAHRDPENRHVGSRILSHASCSQLCCTCKGKLSAA